MSKHDGRDLVKCADCIFAVQGPIDKNNIGAKRPLLCRSKPPQAYPLPAQNGAILTVTVWPSVQDDDMCADGLTQYRELIDG